jgi:hypothetical protein
MAGVQLLPRKALLDWRWWKVSEIATKRMTWTKRCHSLALGSCDLWKEAYTPLADAIRRINRLTTSASCLSWNAKSSQIKAYNNNDTHLLQSWLLAEVKQTAIVRQWWSLHLIRIRHVHYTHTSTLLQQQQHSEVVELQQLSAISVHPSVLSWFAVRYCTVQLCAFELHQIHIPLSYTPEIIKKNSNPWRKSRCRQLE